MKLPDHSTPSNCTQPQNLLPASEKEVSQRSEHGGTVQTSPQKTLPNVVTHVALPGNVTKPQNLLQGE